MEVSLSSSYILAAGVSAGSMSAAVRARTLEWLHWVSETPFALTFASGGVAGAVSRTLTAPMDRIKVLAQEGRARELSMPHPTVQHRAAESEFKAMLQVARYIRRHSGVLGFWRGNGVNCLKAGPECATALATRQVLLQHIVANPAAPTPLEQVALGASAGLIAQVFLYPMEVVKTRIAVSQKNEFRGVVDCVRKTIAQGGVAGLYRGMCANAAGIVPHRGIEMGLFFTLEQMVSQAWTSAAALRSSSSSTRSNGGRIGAVAAASQSNDVSPPPGLPVMYTAAVGIVASVVAQICTYPLNLARTRLQTQGVNGRPVKYTGLVSCLTGVARESGVRGLFAGIAPNMLKAVPSSCLMFVTFRKAQTTIKELGSSNSRQAASLE